VIPPETASTPSCKAEVLRVVLDGTRCFGAIRGIARDTPRCRETISQAGRM
jgi:hypothetical protein